MALGHLESRLHVLRPLIEADSTIEVAINGDGRVWVERAGDSAMSLADVTLSPVEVKDLAGLIANKQRLTLTDALPAISTTIDYAGATLRCQAIIPPASAGGTTITFRVFRRRLAGDAPKHFRFLRDQTVSLEIASSRSFSMAAARTVGAAPMIDTAAAAEKRARVWVFTRPVTPARPMRSVP